MYFSDPDLYSGHRIRVVLLWIITEIDSKFDKCTSFVLAELFSPGHFLVALWYTNEFPHYQAWFSKQGTHSFQQRAATHSLSPRQHKYVRSSSPPGCTRTNVAVGMYPSTQVLAAAALHSSATVKRYSYWPGESKSWKCGAVSLFACTVTLVSSAAKLHRIFHLISPTFSDDDPDTEMLSPCFNTWEAVLFGFWIARKVACSVEI